MLRICVAIAALASLAGCNREIDKDKAEKAIASSLSDHGFDATVTCPAGRPVKKGDVFTCDAVEKDGRKLVINVTQEDDEGSVTFRAAGGALVDTNRIIKEATAKLGDKTKITCPKRAVILTKKDDSTRCPIDGTKQQLVMTLADEAKGDIAWRVE
jgi:uncharacterized protein DUF4333